MYKVPSWVLEECRSSIKESTVVIKNKKMSTKDRLIAVEKYLSRAENIISVLEENYLQDNNIE